MVAIVKQEGADSLHRQFHAPTDTSGGSSSGLRRRGRACKAGTHRARAISIPPAHQTLGAGHESKALPTSFCSRGRHLLSVIVLRAERARQNKQFGRPKGSMGPPLLLRLLAGKRSWKPSPGALTAQGFLAATAGLLQDGSRSVPPYPQLITPAPRLLHQPPPRRCLLPAAAAWTAPECRSQPRRPPSCCLQSSLPLYSVLWDW